MNFLKKKFIIPLLVSLLSAMCLLGVYSSINLRTPTWNVSMMPALKSYPKFGPIQLTPARYITRRTGDVWGTYAISWHHGPGYLYIPRASAVEVDGISLQEEFSGNGFVFEFSGTESDPVHRIAIPMTASAACTTMYFGSYSQISEYIAISSVVINFIKGICLAVLLLSLLFYYFKRSESYLVWLAFLCLLQLFYTEGIDLMSFLSRLFEQPLLANADIYLILQELVSFFCIYKILTESGFSRINRRQYAYPMLMLIPAFIAILTHRSPQISTLFMLIFQLLLYTYYLLYFLNITENRRFEYILLLIAWILTASMRFFDEFCEIGLLPSGYLNTTIHLKNVVSAIFIVAFFLLAGRRFALKFCEADNLNAHLETEIQKKTAQQTVFIRSMLHNLKTPMFSLSGYSDMALKTLDQNPEAAKRYIEKTHEKAVFAGTLMDQIFFVTQLDSGMVQMQFIDIDLNEMLASVISNTGSDAAQTDFHHPAVTCDIPNELFISGDRLYLQQVFQNIFDNARIHTDDSGTIHISAYTNADSVNVVIKDSGCGISEEDQQKIFDAYFSNRHGAQKSSGLGLYISNEIVKRHHGTIRVHSAEGVGSTFIVSLPR